MDGRGVVGRSLVSAAVVFAMWAVPAGANFFQPNRYDDPLPDGCVETVPAGCSLREAWIDALGTPGTDTIQLQPGTYMLTRERYCPHPPPNNSTACGSSDYETDSRGGDLDTTNGTPNAPKIEVVGLGVQETAIESGDFQAQTPNVDRIFEVGEGATLGLAALTVTRGKGTLGFFGHQHGGAIHNHGTLFLDSVTIDSSSAITGGGLTNAGAPNPASATLKNVTVVGNSATGSGGGIENGGNLAANNVTIVSYADVDGGGLSSSRQGGATLSNTIVAPADVNKAGCKETTPGAIVSAGYNLSYDASCPFTATGDKKPTAGNTIDPMWRVVPDYYGFARLLELLPGSPAIDASSPPALPSRCEFFDARAVQRPQDGDGDGSAVCDMGAYEREPPPPPPPDSGGGSSGSTGGSSSNTTNTTATSDGSGTLTTTTTIVPNIAFLASQRTRTATRRGYFNYSFIGAPAQAKGRASFGTANAIAAARKRKLNLGSKAFAAAIGRKTMVVIKLSSRNFAILKRKRSLRVRVTVTIGTITRSTTFTLKAPRR